MYSDFVLLRNQNKLFLFPCGVESCMPTERKLSAVIDSFRQLDLQFYLSDNVLKWIEFLKGILINISSLVNCSSTLPHLQVCPNESTSFYLSLNHAGWAYNLLVDHLRLDPVLHTH